MPVYILGRFGAQLVEDEEETQAQNKVVFGLLFLLLVYPAAFFFLWALFWYTPTGALLAAATVYLFAVYHNKLINDNYEQCVIPFPNNLCSYLPVHYSAKRLVAAWRVLVGVWAPKRWELPLAALSQYTTPETPKENPWIDRPKTPVSKSAPASTATHIAKVIPEPDLVPPQAQEPPVKTYPKRRPPSRRIMRHVLRARAEAVRALAGFFDQLERAGRGKKVHASVHLAKAYGGYVEEVPTKGEDEVEGDREQELQGWREAIEVIGFLRARGAKIPTLGHGPIEGEWAALSSDADNTPVEEKEEVQWVPKGSND